VKATFLGKMAKYDPQGIFRAGAALRKLGISNIKYYEPYNGLIEEYSLLAGASVLDWLLAIERAVLTLSLVFFIFTMSWFRLTRGALNKSSHEEPIQNPALRHSSRASSMKSDTIKVNCHSLATSSVQIHHAGLAREAFDCTDWHSCRCSSVSTYEGNLSFPTWAIHNLDFSWKQAATM
jgi:hypothetical protein